MDFIIDAIVEWLKGLLVDGIMGNLDGLFDNVNQSVGEIATQVGTTPADWNAGVFSMIRQISETAILPIAGVILTFVMTYELIQMLIERNNLHEVDTLTTTQKQKSPSSSSKKSRIKFIMPSTVRLPPRSFTTVQMPKRNLWV